MPPNHEFKVSNTLQLQMHEDGEKIDFFPVNEAKRLKKKDEDETKKQLAELQTNMSLVLSKFEKQVATDHDPFFYFMKSSGAIITIPCHIYLQKRKYSMCMFWLLNTECKYMITSCWTVLLNCMQIILLFYPCLYIGT